MFLKSQASVTLVRAAPFPITAVVYESSGFITAVALRCLLGYILLESGITKFPYNLIAYNVDVREVFDESFCAGIDGVRLIESIRGLLQGVKYVKVSISVRGQIGGVDSGHHGVQEL